MTSGMNIGKTVFSQVMDLVHRETFQRCVHRYHGDSIFRSLSCRDQFLSMAFAQVCEPRPFQISGDFVTRRGGDVRRRDDAPRFLELDSQDRDRPVCPP